MKLFWVLILVIGMYMLALWTEERIADLDSRVSRLEQQYNVPTEH